MGLKVHSFHAVEPRERVRQGAARGEEGYFFPGEVARMLGLDGIDYRQLRRLFVLAREQAGLPTPEAKVSKPVARPDGRSEPRSVSPWTRFTYADVACVRVLIELTGGHPKLAAAGRRMVFAGIAEACSALRARGFANPLLQVPMARAGRSIVAVLDGVVVNPVSGQMTMQAVEELINAYLPLVSLDESLHAAAEREASDIASLPRAHLADRAVVSVWPPVAND